MGNLSNIFNKAIAFNKKIVKNVIANKLPIATDKVVGVVKPDENDFTLSAGKLILNVSSVTTPFFTVSDPVADTGTEVYAYVGSVCIINFTATSLLCPKNTIKEFQLYDINGDYHILTATNGTASFSFSASSIGNYRISVVAVDIENNKSLINRINVYIKHPFIVKPIVIVPVSSTMEKSLVTPFAINTFATSPPNISTLSKVVWTLRGDDGRVVWSGNSTVPYINGPKGSNIVDMKASVYYEVTKQSAYTVYLKNSILITESGMFTPQKSTNYTITCVAAGGTGGTGGKSNKTLVNGAYTVTSGGGAGGGGAGAVVTDALSLLADTIYQVSIGTNGGSTSFDTSIIARGGSVGGNGGDATATTAGIAGIGGSSYSASGKSGSPGSLVTGTDSSIVAIGGTGGSGGVSTDPDGYGAGGVGGKGADGNTTDINSGTAGSPGTQGCVRIVSVSEVLMSVLGTCVCFSPAMSLFYIYNPTTGTIYSSSDGSIWSQTPSIPTTDGCIILGFGNKDYVIFSSATSAMLSPNGAQWSKFLTVSGDEKIVGVCDGIEAYSFIVYTNTRLMLFSSPTTFAQTTNVSKLVTTGNGMIVGVTATSQIVTIKTPAQSLLWEQAFTPTLQYRAGLIKDIVFFKNNFVMIDDRYIHYSEDLVSWTTVDSTITNLLKIRCTANEIIFYSSDTMLAMTSLVNILKSNKLDGTIRHMAVKDGSAIITMTDLSMFKYKMTQLSEEFDITATVTATEVEMASASSDKKTYRYRLN